MNLSDKIMNAVYAKETEMNRGFDKHVNRITGVRLHPRTFHELAAEKEVPQKLELVYENGGYHKLCGIPLEITSDVEGWEIVE